jgi:hypothetical protein
MRAWLTGKKTYEGFPLFLRRPADLNISLLRPSFPTLAVITHLFTKREPDGRPESNYNDSLLEMDCELVDAFDVDHMGVPVLVETFGGERNYYFYVATDADVAAAVSGISSRYPNEKLSWSVNPDPTWGFIEKYAKEHF